MRQLIGLILFCSVCSFWAAAQNTPKAEIFGGYQYTRFDGGVDTNGWNAALTGNLNRWFGITADFSGAYKTISGVDFRQYTYTFGQTISSRRNEVIRPFAHALFGGFHDSASLSGISSSSNGFVMYVGGGLDVKLTHRLAVRAAQIDWMSLRANGSTDNNNFRYSAGIVAHF